VRILPTPLQQPHPPIAAACSGSTDTIDLAAQHGFIPLFGRGSDPADEVKAWGDYYLKAAAAADQPASKDSFHVAHVIYVAESDARARDDVRESMSRSLEQRKKDSPYMKRHAPPGGTLDDVTFDYMVDSGYYWVGAPDTVYELIKGYYERSGGFGTLLIFAGLPTTAPEKWERSMRLLMEEVAPGLVDLDPDRNAVAVS